MKELLLVFLWHQTLDFGYMSEMIEGCYGDCFDMVGESVTWVQGRIMKPWAPGPGRVKGPPSPFARSQNITKM